MCTVLLDHRLVPLVALDLHVIFQETRPTTQFEMKKEGKFYYLK